MVITSTVPKVSLKLRRVALVNVGAYISVYGLRKLAPAVREIVPDTMTFYVSTGAHLHSVKNVLLSTKKDKTDLQQADLEAIAAGLAGYDVIGFSVMTIDSGWAKKIIAEVRKQSPDTYIVIGGMHAIVCPEECLEFADAVCTGEGDLAFDELLMR